MKKILISELSKWLDDKIAELLVESYTKIKAQGSLSDIDYLWNLAWKFFEDCLQAICNYALWEEFKEMGINFDKTFNRLLQKPKNNLVEESLFLIIPQAIKTWYTLRNKRKISHSRWLEPSKIDQELILTIVNWTMFELLRLISDQDELELEKIIKRLSIPYTKIFEIINDEEVLLCTEMSCRDSVLVILYSNYEKDYNRSDITWILKQYYKSSNISRSITRLINNRDIHIDKWWIFSLTKTWFNNINNILIELDKK